MAHMTQHDASLQESIIEQLGVTPTIDATSEITARVDFLADYLKAARARGFVLGISGGQDSTLAGRLAQLAVEKLRDEGEHATFVAVRLPHGTQSDEADAQLALDFIRPDERVTVNIEPATTAMSRAVADALGVAALGDFCLLYTLRAHETRGQSRMPSSA